MLYYSGPDHLLGGPVTRSAEGWTPLHMAATLADATLAEARPARCRCAGRRPLRARRERCASTRLRRSGDPPAAACADGLGGSAFSVQPEGRRALAAANAGGARRCRAVPVPVNG